MPKWSGPIRVCYWCKEDLQIFESIRPVQAHPECSLCVLYDGTFRLEALSARESAKRSALANLEQGLGKTLVASWPKELRERLIPSDYAALPELKQQSIKELLQL